MSYAYGRRHSLAERARRAQAIGYHALVIPDHLIPQLGPIAAMAWIAAATDRVRVFAYGESEERRVLRLEDRLLEPRAELDVEVGLQLPSIVGEIDGGRILKAANGPC